MQGNMATLVNLRVLGQVQPNDRIVADSTYLEIESRWGLANFLRWWRADSREKTLTRIQDVMQQAAHIRGTDSLVKDALQGLQQLMDTTYKDDPLTVARLRVIFDATRVTLPPRQQAARVNLSSSLPNFPSSSTPRRQLERRF